MANFIPEDKISEIRNTVDIVDIISEAVLLKKSGRNYIGICPFHSEKTPSFTVSPEKQIFHCFGCGEGGNVFTFLMKQSGLTFPEAVNTLANRYGIEIPKRSLSPDQRRQLDEREHLLAINQQASDFYCESLHQTAEGKHALTYLAKRGMRKDTITDFKLGYAPRGWDNLFSHFSKKKIPLHFVEKSGLIIPRKNKSGYYDRFRDRIVFPIVNVRQQVIGFGGRVMDDSLPKYLNSPETLLYNKSRSLYGLHRAKNSCRETRTVYIVEGYFDLLALHQHGISNSVATLGTALTEGHVRSLKGLVGQTGKFILVYDSDAAGIRAAQRSIEVFDKGFVDAQILTLDADYDPDTYIFQFGPEKFLTAAERALHIIPFLTESAIKKYGLSIEGKIRILSDLKTPLAALKDPVARSLYTRQLAERIGIEETAVLEKVREASAAGTAQNRQSIYLSRNKSMDAGGLNRDRLKNRKGIANRMERQIITMLLQFPDIIPEVNDSNLLEYIDNTILKEIAIGILNYEKISENHRSAPTATFGEKVHGRISNIMTFINDKEKERIIAELASREDDWDIQGCKKLIHQFIHTGRECHRNNSIDKRIQEAERNGDQKLLSKLLFEKQQLAISKQKQKMSLLQRKYKR